MTNHKPTGPWSPVLMRFNGIEPEPVDWLWYGRLAVGKLHILMGEPGLGKSWLSLDLAARISTGRAWPDGLAGCEGDVLVLSAEDGPADTVRPRLDVLGSGLQPNPSLPGIEERQGRDQPANAWRSGSD